MAYDDDETLRRNRNQSWWKQRTHMERRGIVLLIIAVLIIIGLIIAIALVSHKAKKLQDESGEASSACLTQGCVNAAAQVLKNMDESVDPCSDFYQFACGGFIKQTSIPDDKFDVNNFGLLRDVVKEQVKNTFEERVPDELKAFALVKRFYNACMNTTAIEADGLNTIKKLLEDLGGWPLLKGTGWNEAAFDWKKSMHQFRLHGLDVDGLVGFAIAPDANNSSRRIITLDQATLDVAHENLVNGFQDDLIKAYYDYMVDLAVYFGVDKSFAEYEVREMLTFKMEIAKISIPDEQRRDATKLYNPMTVADLLRSHPSISWLELINSIISVPDKNVTYMDVVNVPVPQFLTGLEKLLQSSTKRVQANHLFFQLVRSLEMYLPEYIRNREQQFKAVYLGTAVRAPRWRECVDATSQCFSIGVGALYARKYFHEDARQNAIKMVSAVQKEFVKILKHVEWMDEDTKKIAIDKAMAIITHIGYPDEYLDDKKIEDYYSGLGSSDKYLEYFLKNQIFLTEKQLQQIRDPINKTDWTTRSSPTTINAFYASTENSIHLPAAILQGVFFDKNRPNYMNYGAIAFFIGHELTHGFDDQGKRYDKDGNLVNWWAEKTNKAFMDKAKCIVDQYSGYTVPEVDLKIHGENTQGENIADNGGIKEAYFAYNTWVEANGPEQTLPGLNYTARQMFWISTANCWCSKERKESLEHDISSDNHSPTRFRVIGPFSNIDHFAKDFNCPTGSNMNPKHKCQVW